MNGAIGSRNCTRSIAGRSRSAARATSGLWNAPETFSLTVRRAPSSSASRAALVDGVVLAGDDDLAGAVVVRRPHAEDLRGRGARRPRRRGRGSRPSSRAAPSPPRPSPARARGRARSPRRRQRRRRRRARRTRRPSGRRRSRARCPRSRSAASMARLVATSAGCCSSVSTSSSIGASKQSCAQVEPRRLAAAARTPPWPRGRPRRRRGPCRPRASPAPGSRTRSCSMLMPPLRSASIPSAPSPT